MEPNINWGSEARPYHGSRITWYLKHNQRVLVWRGGDELVRYHQVVIEGDEDVELTDGSTRASQSSSEFCESIVLTPKFDQVALLDAVTAAAKFFGLGNVTLSVDSKHLDHIVITMEAE